MSDKEKIIEAVKELPMDATYFDAIEKIYLMYNIEKGLSDINEGRVISHEEAKKRLQKWLK